MVQSVHGMERFRGTFCPLRFSVVLYRDREEGREGDQIDVSMLKYIHIVIHEIHTCI